MIDCKEVVNKYKAKMKSTINGRKIGLAVIQVGNDCASSRYIKGKISDCNEVGIDLIHVWFRETTTTDQIIDTIEGLNEDKNIHGIIVQLPLPEHLDYDKILNTIVDSKDVDGFKSTSRFTPCTPLGIMILLDNIGVDVAGKKCCVISRSKIVGKPLVNILIDSDATVTCCHSKTKYSDKKSAVVNADIVITATGKKNSIIPEMVHNGQVIIDVGINRGDDGKICGDCDRDIYDIVDMVTPVPGGVGLLTRLALLSNVVDAALTLSE